MNFRKLLLVSIALLALALLTACGSGKAPALPQAKETFGQEDVQFASMTPPSTQMLDVTPTATPPATIPLSPSPSATKPLSPTPTLTPIQITEPTAVITAQAESEAIVDTPEEMPKKSTPKSFGGAIDLPIPVYGSLMGDVAFADGSTGAMMIGKLPEDKLVLYLVVTHLDGLKTITGHPGLIFLPDEHGTMRAPMGDWLLEDVKADERHIEGTLKRPLQTKFNLRYLGTPTRAGFLDSAKLVTAVGAQYVQGVDSVADKETVDRSVIINEATILRELSLAKINVPTP